MGSEGVTFPPNVGIPLHEEHGGATYFMIEIHYDNPTLRPNIVDNSGVKLFYTENLREFDAATLRIGHELNALHTMPPEQKSFVTTGRCTSDCTSGVRCMG